MGLMTLAIAAIHACAAFLNFRLGFFLLIFFYATYPRLLAVGMGEQGFALTAQRIMLLTMMFLFALRYLYGATDVRKGVMILRQETMTLLLFGGLLCSRLAGNLLTGRLDLAAIVSFVDESVFSLFIVVLAFSCLRGKRDVYMLLLVAGLSLLPNELIAIYEFIAQKSIFPASLQIDFETARSAEGMVAGGIRYGSYRVMGTFESSLKLMALCILMIPIVGYLVKTTTEPLLRGVLIFVLAMQPVVIFWTGSRTGLMMLVLITAFYSYRFVQDRFGSLEAKIMVTIMGIVAAIVMYLSIDSILDGFLFGQETSKSSASRFLQYAFSWPLIQESPWFGYGYARNIVDVIDLQRMDGYYLRTVMEGGLVALGCLVGLFVKSIRSLSRMRRAGDDGMALALQAALASMAVMMLALNMGMSSFYTYLFFGLTVILERAAREQTPSFAPNRAGLASTVAS